MDCRSGRRSAWLDEMCSVYPLCGGQSSRQWRSEVSGSAIGQGESVVTSVNVSNPFRTGNALFYDDVTGFHLSSAQSMNCCTQGIFDRCER